MKFYRIFFDKIIEHFSKFETLTDFELKELLKQAFDEMQS